MEIKLGATAEVIITVSADRTADAMGNRGVKVLATPFLVGLLENACRAVVGPHLPAGAGTVGTEYPPFPVTVERGRLKDFARALGDPNPFYVNDAVGTASPWGDVIAPPTFAISFRDETADSGALLRDLGVDISRLLHGEQEF